MKHQEQIMTGLTTHLEDGSPFEITGHPDTLAELKDRYDQEDARMRSRKGFVEAAGQALVAETVKDTPKLPKYAIGAEIVPHEPITSKLGRIVTDFQVRRYDRKHGTQFTAAVAERRALERNRLFAAKLGLLSVSPCQKHRDQLAKVAELQVQ